MYIAVKKRNSIFEALEKLIIEQLKVFLLWKEQYRFGIFLTSII